MNQFFIVCTTWMLALALSGLIGCATRGNVELLESRLRLREDRMVDLESDLTSARTELAAARRESNDLRTQLAGRGETPLLPEQADVLYRASGIRFNKLRTGGVNSDGSSGDDLLTAVLVPHDGDGEPVKLPGEINLQLFEPTDTQSMRQIGNWTIGVENSHDHWHRGFLGSGYLFRLPWQTPPQKSQLTLHARLTTADGRRFNTTQLVHVTPTNASFADSVDDAPQRLRAKIPQEPVGDFSRTDSRETDEADLGYRLLPTRQ
jgi:hypothetical protein